ncbi:M48 family metallopeptidase [Flammeovirga aprica]|uniref:M48 family metallopeptidase n=1 Tax=Flammeovirga aprica JL-4 TaxID=694437 RepID=A0A7X9RWE0_9BACT|nr:M48 family metallopeptidase [Flammeovirga aprica]NME69952.1 M48 family metallopeptidase [Flammeovirga aprica JL-4]
MSSEALKVHKKKFPNINPNSWEHPTDKLALAALQKMTGFDTLLKFIISNTTEKSLRLMTLASSVRVNENQFPKVHRLLLEACAILDVKEIPELYVSQSPILNAGAIGVDNPFIVLNSSIVDTLNEEELLTVIGHELGHIISGHVLYHTLLRVLLRISIVDLGIPLGKTVILAIIMALKEWERKSELSADRAGLLSSQNPETSIHLLMKLAGGGNIAEMNLGEFIKQAEEYNQQSGLVNTTHKFLNTIFKSHPFPVTRIAELLKWVQSGEYDNILNGGYDHSPNTPENGKTFNFKEDFKEYTDPITDKMKDAKDFVTGIFSDEEEDKKVGEGK